MCAAAPAQPVDVSAPAPARQRPKRVLLDMELRASVIEPLSIDQRAVVYQDESGRAREVRTSQVAAIIPYLAESGATAVLGSEAEGLLILADGQRFPGRRSGAPAEQDVLAWEHPTLGSVAAPLDLVSEVRYMLFLPSGDPVFLEPAPRDRALLVNGDRLEGFIESLGDPVRIETPSGDVELPAARVAGARLANPRQEQRGLALWLEDGTVARVRSLETDGRGGASATLADAQSARLSLDQIIGVVFDGSRLRPLARIAPQEQSAAEGRPLLDPMRIADDFWAPAVLDAPSIELPGPMQVMWTLPEGATRLGGVGRLPRSSWVWGDCELVIEVDEQEVLRERLHRGRPTIEFSVPVRGRELTIRIEPGAYGPIQDRVILERALILLAPGEG